MLCCRLAGDSFTLLLIWRGAFALLPICLTVHFPRNSWYNKFCICDPLKEGEERDTMTCIDEKV